MKEHMNSAKDNRTVGCKLELIVRGRKLADLIDALLCSNTYLFGKISTQVQTDALVRRPQALIELYLSYSSTSRRLRC